MLTSVASEDKRVEFDHANGWETLSKIWRNPSCEAGVQQLQGFKKQQAPDAAWYTPNKC